MTESALLPQYAAYRRKARSCRLAALATVSGLAIIVFALPKPRAYASPERLAMTIACFGLLAGGLPICLRLARGAADARLAFQYQGASNTLKTTIAYLKNERHSARRGVVPSLTSAISVLGFHTISVWPQCAALAPYQEVFGAGAAVALGLAAFAPFWQRKNVINAIYLRNTLRLQARQIGFRRRTGRDARRLMAELARPAVTEATANGFRAGGFDWVLDDFQKNAVVLGAPGTGKTITVLLSLMEGLLASSALSPFPTAGLAIDPKGAFKAQLRKLLAKYGREGDLVILSAEDWERDGGTMNAIRFNPFDSVDDSLELAAQIVTAGKLAGGIKSGNDSFFVDAARAFIRRALDLVRSAGGPEPPNALDIRRLATERPEEGKSSGPFYLGMVTVILAHYPKFEGIPAETKDALDYFENEWRKMPDRQKGGVISYVTQVLDDFSVEPFRSMMCGHSTISIAEILDTGKILYVDLPAAARPRMAALTTGLIKLAFQREVLRRVRKDRPSFLVADEWHLNWSTGETQGDAEFFSLSRESNHANIVAAQNVSSFYKKVTNKDEARNFLGNCAVKIFLRNTETETNSWASQLFGERSEITVSSNENASLDHPVTRGMTSYARSTITARTVPPEAFTRLAIPLRSDPSRQYAEAIVHLASRGTTQKLDLVWRVNDL